MIQADLTAAPVMRKASSRSIAQPVGEKLGEDVQAVAVKGVQGDGQQLPHIDRIQASFGDHDVSGIDAHIGGDAAAAGKAMGAQGYATGNSVAFNSPPDLHTAAHEAAHVVQQRSGVQLKAGVGQVGDKYEQNADAVADRVVVGRSAQDLLPAGASPRALAVQHQNTSVQMRPGRDDLEDPFSKNATNKPKKDRDALQDPFNKVPEKTAGHRDDLEDPFGGIEAKGGDHTTTVSVIDLSPAEKDGGTNELGLNAEETKKMAAALSTHAGIVEKKFTDAGKNAKAGADKRREDINKQNPKAKTKKDKPPPKQLDQLKLRISLKGLDKSPIRPVQRAMAVRFLEKAFAHYGVKKMGRSSLVKLVDASGWKTTMAHTPKSGAWWKRWVQNKLKRGIKTTSYTGTGVWEALDRYQRENERRARAYAKFRSRLGSSTYAQDAILTFYKAQVNGAINIVNGAITLASAGKVKNPIPKLKYHGEYAKKNAAVLEAGATVVVGVITGGLAAKGFAALSARLSGVVVNGVNVGDKILLVAQMYMVGSGLRETHALAEQARDDILLLANKEVVTKEYTSASGAKVVISRPATKEELQKALDRIIMTAAGTVAGAIAGRGMQAKGGKAGSGNARVKKPGLPKATAKTSRAKTHSKNKKNPTTPGKKKPDGSAKNGTRSSVKLPEGGVRRPASRHTAASVKQSTLPRNKNTVYDKSVDVAADVKAINEGKATLSRNSDGETTATVNGRTYAVEPNGTLSPRVGAGFHQLSRAEFKALGVYNKFGNSDRANQIMTNMGIGQAERAKALVVWKRLQ